MPDKPKPPSGNDDSVLSETWVPDDSNRQAKSERGSEQNESSEHTADSTVVPDSSDNSESRESAGAFAVDATAIGGPRVSDSAKSKQPSGKGSSGDADPRLAETWVPDDSWRQAQSGYAGDEGFASGATVIGGPHSDDSAGGDRVSSVSGGIQEDDDPRLSETWVPDDSRRQAQAGESVVEGFVSGATRMAGPQTVDGAGGNTAKGVVDKGLAADSPSLSETWVPDDARRQAAGETSDDEGFAAGATVAGGPPDDDGEDEAAPARQGSSSREFDVTATFVPKSFVDEFELSDSDNEFGSAATVVGSSAGGNPDDASDGARTVMGSVADGSAAVGAGPDGAADLKTVAERPAVVGDATIVLGGADDSETKAQKGRKELKGTFPLGQKPKEEGTGSGTGSGLFRSGFSSKVTEQIWSSSATSGLDELVSIRVRAVAGADLQEEGETADFQIVEKLAEGGMGVVYIARQTSLNRQLAIKTLKSSAGKLSGTVGRSNASKARTRAEHQKREMFLSEALVTANLVHPNIIPIHELAETSDGVPYYVMKQVHGIPWNKRITEMSLDENLEVMHKVCDAVAFAHHHGVINRDLKPENIMLGEFGEVLVLDWGLAVPAPHAAEQKFRSPVASFGAGTPAYMSPELWAGPAEAIGECSDIYLLGAILFEVITGKPPHEFPKAEGSGRAELWNTIDSVLRANLIRETDASGELFDIAMKCLRANPDERFGSVLELQVAIRNFQRHEESRRLSSRAVELVETVDAQPRDYHTYQTATALFEESIRTWPQNEFAQTNLRGTRMRYAKLAESRGDYDLGLQVASQESDAEFVSLAKKLHTAKRLRSGIKWTLLAAMLCVVALGAKSIYDNGIITNLNVEVAARKAEASEAIAKADDARLAADKANDEAKTATANSLLAQQEADVAKVAAKDAQDAAGEAKEAALIAQADADKARADTAASKLEAEKAVAAAEAANKEVIAANQKVIAANEKVEEAGRLATMAEEKAELAKEQQRQAETAAKVAEVEIQNQSIRALTLNQNYADALREIDRLLESELLPQLPEEIRDQRTSELQAQRTQLLRRVRPSPEPVQTQAVSPDRKLLAMGDAGGLVTVMPSPGSALAWEVDGQRQLQFDYEIAALLFIEPAKLVIASGADLYLWDLLDEDPASLSGHQHAVQAIDANGQYLLTADVSGRIVIRSQENGRTLSELNLRTQLRDVAFIPGTNDFICAGARGSESADIMAYRLSTSAENTRPQRLGQLRMSRRHNEPPRAISISPDGRLLAISNGNNGQMIVLAAADAATGARQFPFLHPADLEAKGDQTWLLTGHSRPINDIVWSRDGKKCLTASDDRTIGVWSRSGDGDQILVRDTVLRGHGARVTQAQFLDAEAARVASCSADRLNRLWNLDTLEEDQRQIREAFKLAGLFRGTPANQQPRVSAASLPRDYQLTVLSSSSESGVVELPAGTQDERPDADPPSSGRLSDEVAVLNTDVRLHRGVIQSIRYSRDDQHLVAGAADGSVVIWDAAAARPVAWPVTSRVAAQERFHEGHDYNLARMNIIGQGGSLLATAGYDGSLRIWEMDPASGRLGIQRQVIAGLGLVNSFAASPSGEFLVTSAIQREESTEAGQCHVWDLKLLLDSPDAVPSAMLSGGHKSEVTAIAVSPDNQQIATGGRDGVICIWDVAATALLTSLKAHGKNTIVTSLQWTPDGSLLSSGLDGQLVRWEIRTERGESGSYYRLVKSVAFRRPKTPIEQMLVSQDGQRILTLSVETDKKTKTTRQHLDVWSAQSAEAMHRVRLATVAGQKPAVITSAAWSSDGRRLLVCADGHVQVVDADSWKILRVLAAGTAGCSDAQFAAGISQTAGKELIITFDGTTARLWNLENGDLLASFRGPFPVSAVAFLHDEDRDFVLAGGIALRIFDARDDVLEFGRPLFRTLDEKAAQITSVDACPSDPSVFVMASSAGSVTIWRWNPTVQEAEKLRELKAAGMPVSCCRWSNDGSDVLVIGRDGVVLICAADGSIHKQIRLDSESPVRLTAGEFSDDGRYFLAVGEVAGTAESTGWVVQLDGASSADAAQLPVESSSPDPASTARVFCTFSGHQAGGITAAEFIPGSPYLVSGGNDGAMILWNWQQPLPGANPAAYEAFRFMEAGQTTAHGAPVTSISVAKSGRIASAGMDGKISVWALPVETAQK